MKNTGQYIIYKQKMHIKTRKNVKNLRPRKEYYMPDTSFECATECNEIGRFIYPSDSAYL